MADPRQGFDIPQLDGKSILLVEHEPATAALFRLVLQETAADVLMATSTQEAWAYLQTHIPDLLVCNIRMPEVDGLELIERIRASQDTGIRQIPALGIADYRWTTSEHQAIAAGFDCYLSQPCNLQSLSQIISELIR